MKILSALSILCVALLGYLGFTSFTTQPAEKKPFSNEYHAQLLSTEYVGGNYEWKWSVTNPLPGDGSNGTLQDLSHWSMAIADLVSLEDIVAVEYSLDGTTWTPLPISLAIDKSQECYPGTVLKFDYGTTGGTTTYFRLVVNKYFTTGPTTSNFKSGKVTGCYNGTVESIGIPSTDPTPR